MNQVNDLYFHRDTGSKEKHSQVVHNGTLFSKMTGHLRRYIFHLALWLASRVVLPVHLWTGRIVARLGRFVMGGLGV